MHGFLISHSKNMLTLLQVYAAGSEDMDTLTFSAPILFRHLTFSEAKKQPINEINLQVALEGLEMDMSQVLYMSFICCLCYSSTCIYFSLSTSASYLDATTSSLSRVSGRKPR